MKRMTNFAPFILRPKLSVKFGQLNRIFAGLSMKFPLLSHFGSLIQRNHSVKFDQFYRHFYAISLERIDPKIHLIK